jgi:hypothetical protein
LIKPRTRGKSFVQVRTRLEQQNYDTLHAYAAFLNEDVDYILNEVIDRALARDKDYVHWRATHPSVVAPPALPARPPTRDARGPSKPKINRTARVSDLVALHE